MIEPRKPLEGVGREWIALHESLHAVAAMEMGLPVSWVDINAPIIGGHSFTAATFIPRRVEFPDDAEAVAVSLGAPSRWPTEHEELDYYAGLELTAALEIAGNAGIDSMVILDQIAHIVRDREDDIYELRNRLVNEGGRVEFAAV